MSPYLFTRFSTLIISFVCHLSVNVVNLRNVIINHHEGHEANEVFLLVFLVLHDLNGKKSCESHYILLS